MNSDGGRIKKYVFLCKKTGKPLTLHIESNPPDAECCGDTTVTLDAPHPDRALFAVNTLQEAIEARAFDVGWYNSTATQPCHGDYKPEDIDIAEMEVVFKKVSFKGPLVIAGTDIYDSRDIPWVIAKQVGPDVAEEFVNKIMKIVEEAKNQPDKLSQVTVVKKEPGVEFN